MSKTEMIRRFEEIRKITTSHRHRVALSWAIAKLTKEMDKCQ